MKFAFYVFVCIVLWMILLAPLFDKVFYAMHHGSITTVQQFRDVTVPTNMIVEQNGQVIHLERLDHFVENVRRHKNDKIEITAYTLEGGPILKHLVYSDGKIKYIVDTTEDAFGNGTVTGTTCKAIKVEYTNSSNKNTPMGTKIFSLTNCTVSPDPAYVLAATPQ